MNAMICVTRKQTWMSLAQCMLGAALCGMLALPSFAQVPAEATVNDTTENWADGSGAPPVVGSMIDGSVPADGNIVYDESQLMGEEWQPGLNCADCGYSCPPAWRIDANYAYFNREGGIDDFTLTNSFILSQPGYVSGVKLTLGRFNDCLDGWEMTYLGPFRWQDSDFRVGAGQNTLLPADPGINLSSFNNATLHAQLYRSEYQSFEINRKWAGWDVVMQTLGVRYLNLDERYLFLSNSAAGPGAIQMETGNHLLGVQYGLDMIYPLNRWETRSWMKGGLYGNVDDARVLVVNAGTAQLDNSDDDLDFGSMLEFGLRIAYRWRPNISISAGYEVAWIYGLALAPDQLRSSALSANTGRSLDGNGDLFIHGGTVGIEAIW